jgi:hypothetical protein
LSSYLRPMSGKAPSIYGPSADEGLAGDRLSLNTAKFVTNGASRGAIIQPTKKNQNQLVGGACESNA